MQPTSVDSLLRNAVVAFFNQRQVRSEALRTSCYGSPPAVRVVAAGFMWPEAQALIQQKAFLMHVSVGRGHVIAFAEDPNYRAFTEATGLLFINAVLLGSGF